MTDQEPLRREEREHLAAEYALGLLTGAELAEAEALARSDRDFATEAGRWTGRLAPVLDEVESREPPDALWDRIAARISLEAEARPDNVVRLRRGVGLWRAYAAAATAIAASLAWLLMVRAPPPPAVAPLPPPPMVAAMTAQGSPAQLVATWNPGSRSLVVAAAVPPAAAPGKDHELWFIPADGKPRPMGLMPRSGAMRATLAPEMARQLAAGVTLAVSVEPIGGSPTGLPTGPVIAAGPLVAT